MRSTAHLPSLAGLRLGGTADAAPTGTGMETRAARRRRVDNPPAPPPQPLVGLPRDMLELIVKQAVASARTSPTPVHDVCEWMKGFCRSAKMQGVGVGCEDGWYLIAMGVFGYTPDSPATEALALPSYSVFKSWRELFDVLCEVFDVRVARFQNNTAALLAQLVWHKVDTMMRNDWVPLPYSTLGQFVVPMDDPPTMTPLIEKWRAVAAVYRDPRDQTQRHLDTLLEIVLQAMIETRFVAIAEREGDREDMNTQREEIGREFKSDWEKWTRNEPNSLSDPKMSREHKGFMAVVQLLLLRGAEPFTRRAYERLDSTLHEIMKELSKSHISLDTALNRLRDALDQGVSLENYKWHINSMHPEEDPEYILWNAMRSAIPLGNGDVINLLLDRGWKLQLEKDKGGVLELMRDRGWDWSAQLNGYRGDMRSARETFRRFLNRTTRDWMDPEAFQTEWTADAATTKRLIKAMQPWVDHMWQYRREEDPHPPPPHAQDEDHRAWAQNILDWEAESDIESPYKGDWLALLLRPGDSLEEYRAEQNAMQLELNATHGWNEPLPYS